eukprot:3303683-Lingulodinium_polyedra.AAC.1
MERTNLRVRSAPQTTPRRLIGALGVYVDDFLFVESEDPEWKDLMKNIKGLYQWGKHNYYDFTLRGVRCRQ